MHRAEPEAAQFIEREVAIVAWIGSQQVVRIFRANAGQLVGQHLARHAQAVVVRASAGSSIVGVARLGVGQMAFSCWTLRMRASASARQGGIVLELAEARIDDGDRLQDIAILVELEVQRVGDARVRASAVSCVGDPVRSDR